MNLTGLLNDIADAETELEELNERGDLEDRLEASTHLAELEEMRDSGRPVTFMDCGLCHGTGEHILYGDRFFCTACAGRGGSWQYESALPTPAKEEKA